MYISHMMSTNFICI